MRMLSKLAVAATVVATAATLAAGPALADPVNGSGKAVAPRAFDLVGTGSNTIEYVLDQLSVDYNGSHKTHNATHPWFYSWDATNPTTSAIGDLIATKPSCAKIARPNGSGAGIATLLLNTKDPANKADFCDDYGRSSGGRTTQATGPGGVLFVALAKDNVSYATLAKGSNAPKNLSLQQLHNIYNCTATTWNQVGGKSTAKIVPVLPQASSGTRSFFLAAINITAASNPCWTTNPGLEENEGTAKVFQGNKNAIVPFSAGKWLAQQYHSKAACKKPAPKGKNMFGCNVNGVLALNNIGGFRPILPAVNKKSFPTLNPHFAQQFVRTVYDVVRFATNTSSHIPARLNPIFGHGGYICTSAAGKAAIANYGFLTTPLCGLGF
jgi:ABC-type phosphate transport system substrate-binding protein